jgi:para-nitrobenzyl esterase
VLGACHALDVPLVFGPAPEHGDGRPGISEMLLGTSPSANLLALGDLMREEWIRFASGGDPGWERYSTTHRTTRIYDMPSDVLSYPEESSMRLWQRHPFGVMELG